MLVQRISAAQQSREFHEQPVIDRHPLRREELLVSRLGKLRRGHHAEVVMMVLAITGRRLVIVMMLAMLRLSDVRAERLPAMLQRHMRAGTEPGEQHQRRDELAG